MPPPKPEDWKCEACDGTGMAVPDCEECEGNGWIDDEEDGGTMTCPSCGGDKCDHCGGEGQFEVPYPFSKWSNDPHGCTVEPCGNCEGRGFFICEAEGESMQELTERLKSELIQTLNGIAPAIEALACHQQQLDMDGVIVGVSRQAVHEVIEAVNAMACMLSPPPRTTSNINKCPACSRMFVDGETCSRGGCPMGGDF